MKMPWIELSNEQKGGILMKSKRLIAALFALLIAFSAAGCADTFTPRKHH
jgi:hypothetical protein